ncbi:MAG: hypothetical protein HY289_14250 [Planctomycetes bacterium]|nr:hypothetical protein [Planctomycetota bacterium]
MTVVKTTIRNRRIDVPAPTGLPDGTEVTLTIDSTRVDDEPMAPDEIARVLTAMRQLPALEIPADTAADLDAWEQKINQYGIANADRGTEEAFP